MHIGDLLEGIRFEDEDRMPDGFTPLACVVLVKCLDETGTVSWAVRATPDLHSVEVLGAIEFGRLSVAKDVDDALEDG